MRPSFEELETFVHVVECHGVTAAAARLRVAKSVVSKRLTGLETSLGVKLFHRAAREMVLTEPGLLTFERAKSLLPRFNQMIDDVASQAGTFRGPIHVAGPQTFGSRYLAPVIVEFMELHPGVTISFDLDDRLVDIAGEGYDVAIRIGRLADSALKARRIVQSERGIFCSKGYLEKFGTPRTLECFAHHHCLGYANSPSTHIWQFVAHDDSDSKSLNISTRFLSNSGDALITAARLGAGLAVTPLFLARDAISAGELVEVRIPGWVVAPDDVFAIFSEGADSQARIRALIDHVASRLHATRPGSRDAS